MTTVIMPMGSGTPFAYLAGPVKGRSEFASLSRDLRTLQSTAAAGKSMLAPEVPR